MGGIVCQILAARRPPCQIVKVRLTLTQCQSVGLARPPSDVKVSDTVGPLCVKFFNKTSSLLSIFLDRRCTSKSRPAVGPLVSNFPEKRSSPLSQFGRPCGSVQTLGPVKFCPPVSNFSNFGRPLLKRISRPSRLRGGRGRGSGDGSSLTGRLRRIARSENEIESSSRCYLCMRYVTHTHRSPHAQRKIQHHRTSVLMHDGRVQRVFRTTTRPRLVPRSTTVNTRKSERPHTPARPQLPCAPSWF